MLLFQYVGESKKRQNLSRIKSWRYGSNKREKKTGSKDYKDKWSKETYEITYIKGGDYLISDINRKRIFLRHELLKVK